MATLSMNAAERDDVIRAALARTEQFCAKHGIGMGEGTCVFVAHAITAELLGRGRACRVAAGSATFPTVKDADDDGVTANQFSFVFEPESAGAFMTTHRRMPELHAWCVLGAPRDRDPELVDGSTGRLPEHLYNRLGATWEPHWHQPPEYLWCRASRVPPRYGYCEHPLATRIVTGFMKAIQNAPPGGRGLVNLTEVLQ